MIKVLPLLHITLAAQRCMLCRQGFSSLVCQAVAPATQVLMTIVTNNARRNGPVSVLQRVYQMMPFLPLNWLIFSLLIKGWAVLAHLVFIFLLFQSLEPHHHHKASNHHIISKINASFLLQYLLHGNSLIHGISNVILNVTAQCCSDLTLLFIDNMHFF